VPALPCLCPHDNEDEGRNDGCHKEQTYSEQQPVSPQLNHRAGKHTLGCVGSS
jgi:hypothetical protein